MANEIEQNNGEIIIYLSEDGKIRLDVRLENKTVWLTIDQMAELYGKSRSTINEHILNAYKEGEVDAAVTMRKIGNSDFSTKPTNYYNLDVIISVGYPYLESIKLIEKKTKGKQKCVSTKSIIRFLDR